MAESLVLFESIINTPWFLTTSIIFFLNKIDVFKTKLPKPHSPPIGTLLVPHVVVSQVPLERYFPEYLGGAFDNKATKYILWGFIQTNRAHLSVYPQYVPSLCFPQPYSGAQRIYKIITKLSYGSSFAW